MAKKYHNKGKGVIGIIVACTVSALVLGAAAGVMAYGTDGFKDPSFPAFSGKAQTEQVQDIDTEDNMGGMEITDVESQGISIMSIAIPTAQYPDYGISTIAESAVRISAKITPEDATYTGLTWTVDFSDKGGWAEDKTATEYVSLDSYKTGGGYGDIEQTVNVSCMQAFGSAITIKVISDDNPEAFATCKVDYIQRLLNLDISLNDRSDSPMVTSNGTINVPEDVLDDTSNKIWYSVTFIPTFSECTITENGWNIRDFVSYCTIDGYDANKYGNHIKSLPAEFNKPMNAYGSPCSDSFTDLFGFEIYSGYEENARRIYEEQPPIHVDVSIGGSHSQNTTKMYRFTFNTDWQAALYKSVKSLSMGMGSDNIVF